MTDLYIVRHGQTAWNLERRIQGVTDIPLDDTGREQARDAALALSETLADAGPLRVVTSDLVRARETARIIAEVLGADEPRVYPDLRERAYGEAEGALVDEFRDRWGEWHIAQVPGAEPWDQLRARGIRGLLRVAEDAGPTATSIVAVSHGGMIGELIRHASDGALPRPGERIGNGSLHRFAVSDGALRLISYSGTPIAAPA